MKRAFNNNYSPLPFYRMVRQYDGQGNEIALPPDVAMPMQLRYATYSFKASYPLLCPKNVYPCFQIYEPEGTAPVANNVVLYLMSPDNSQVKQLSKSTGFHVATLSSGGYVIFDSGNTIHTNSSFILPLGTYYIKMVDNDNDIIYYSDFFTVVGDALIQDGENWLPRNYLKVEWRNLDNLETESGIVFYTNAAGTTTFTNRVYLQTQLGKPEYMFDEEGETRNGHFFATKQVSYKKYKAVFEAPEYLLDAMRLIRLADIVTITDPYGTQLQADTFLITPQWTEQGNIATCTMEITCDTVVKKCGRATT